jgi:hypothetical protein
MNHRCKRPFHIRTAASVDPFVLQVSSERVIGPAIPRQHVDGIHVRIEEQCRPVVATLDCADNVPGFVNRYPVEAEPFHFFADVRSHRLFMT